MGVSHNEKCPPGKRFKFAASEVNDIMELDLDLQECRDLLSGKRVLEKTCVMVRFERDVVDAYYLRARQIVEFADNIDEPTIVPCAPVNKEP